MLHWPWKHARIYFCQASKVNSPDLPITCSLKIFMSWVFMMILITYVHFMLGLNLRERRGWTTLPLASFVGSKTRGTIINNTLITCHKWIYIMEYLTRPSLFFGFWKKNISDFLLLFPSLRERCSILFFLLFIFRIRVWVTPDPLKYFIKLYVP